MQPSPENNVEAIKLSSKQAIDLDLDWILDGDPDGIFNLANDLRALTKTKIITRLYVAAHKRGVEVAALNLGRFLDDRNDVSGAKKWYKIAYHQGDPRAAVMRGDLLRKERKYASALKWYRLGSDVPESAYHHAKMAKRLGFIEEAKSVLQRHMDHNADAAVEYVLQYGKELQDGGLSILEGYWAAGDLLASVPLANFYAKLGRFEDEEKVLRAAISAGESHAAFNLGINLNQVGKPLEAKAFIALAKELGDSRAAKWLANEDWDLAGAGDTCAR
ncbi:hypothetical protein V5R04_08095 [Jonesiaceae bacterium BS-20]|uniref:Sel1 repeat family protein n=1 Tax=Jonesiaceae bacterium BS-20 TaxID=3120821 RepID=A0AAU7DRA1_9MICO